jgi:hypothetical protein
LFSQESPAIAGWAKAAIGVDYLVFGRYSAQSANGSSSLSTTGKIAIFAVTIIIGIMKIIETVAKPDKGYDE